MRPLGLANETMIRNLDDQAQTERPDGSPHCGASPHRMHAYTTACDVSRSPSSAHMDTSAKSTFATAGQVFALHNGERLPFAEHRRQLSALCMSNTSLWSTLVQD